MHKRKMFYTYVLRSAKSGRWYTGATHDLRKRLVEHNSGKSGYTKHRGIWELIYYEACANKEDAFARESYLKSGAGKRYLQKRLVRFLSVTG